MKDSHTSFPYEDIIALPHPTSVKRGRMSQANRAAQFQPFSALSGYEDVVDETARLVDSKVELDEGEKERINQIMCEALSNSQVVNIQYFCADKRKAGGSYRQANGVIRRFIEIEKAIQMMDGLLIPVDDILSISQDG